MLKDESVLLLALFCEGWVHGETLVLCLLQREGHLEQQIVLGVGGGKASPAQKLWLRKLPRSWWPVSSTNEISPVHILKNSHSLLSSSLCLVFNSWQDWTIIGLDDHRPGQSSGRTCPADERELIRTCVLCTCLPLKVFRKNAFAIFRYS